jgi:hypothetical protein
MRLRSIFLLLGAALHLSVAGCGTLPSPKIERGIAYQVRFPNPWTARSTDDKIFVMTLPFGYEVRKAEAAPWSQLLFALKASAAPISRENYTVDLGRDVVVTPAPAGAWERAVPIPGGNSYFGDTGSDLFPALRVDSTKPVFEFQSRTYERTGETWSRFMLSPEKTFLAALTYTSPEKPTKGHIIFGGGEPTRGEFYWDVYATASGEKVASGSFAFNDISPGIISATAQWIADKYLLLPLDETAQRCLLIAAKDK